MANTHALFQNYNQKIRISDDKRNILFTVRESLRARMKANYLLIPAETRMQLELLFQSQGSVVMDTIITPLNDDFDLDDGVYFQGKNISEGNRPTPSTFHEWVMQAVDKDNDYELVTDKPTCVRVKYKSGFHIDLPIYFVDNFDHPDLAHTEKGWMLSNPVEFIEWFEKIANSGFQKAFMSESLEFAEPYQKWLSDIRKQDCQIRRIVRFMKAWGDLKRNEMPCGIILTILVANNFAPNNRDDIAFRDTLINVKNYLKGNGFKCPRPTSPLDEDLFAPTSQTKKQYFMSALESLISSANKAIDSPSENVASEEWAKHLGTRFPIIPAPAPKPTIKSEQPNLEDLKQTAYISRPWSPKQ